MGFRTRQIHAGVTPDPQTGSILTPIYQTTTYVQPSVDEYLSKGFTYSRSGNPTVKALELKLADLEGGVDAACFGTGMSAIHATMLAFLSAGSHAIISDVAYGGTYRLCTKILTKFGIEFTFADGSNTDDVAAAVRDNTKLILTETPANPTMKCSDIAAISEVARDAGAVHAVDNTFLTPYYQLPLSWAPTCPFTAPPSTWMAITRRLAALSSARPKNTPRLCVSSRTVPAASCHRRWPG